MPRTEMTNKEAIEVLKNDIEICTIQQKQACDMAIKALEQTELEPSYNGVNTELDCISREAVEKITWEEPSYTDALNVLTEVREKVRALPSVTPKTEWIPCSERLPNEFVDVLCNTDSEEIFIATYLGKMNDGTDCFDDNNGMMWEGDVVAWIPLPDVYKESEE